MTFQAYLDNIKAKTGKTPDDFRTLAAKKGLTQYGEIMAWLKADYGLGHGHANAIAQLIVNPDAPKSRRTTRSPNYSQATRKSGASLTMRC